MVDDGGPHRTSVAGGQAVLGSKGFDDQPVRHARVIRQSLIGGLERRFDIGLARARRRNDERCKRRPGIADDDGLTKGRLRQQRRLDPLWRNIAAVGRDQQVLAPTHQVEVTSLVELAEIAGGEIGVGIAGAADVAQKGRGADHHLATLDANARVGQWPADIGATTVVRRPVQGHHRAAFGQSISLIGRNAPFTRLSQEVGVDAPAAHRGKAKPVLGLATRILKQHCPGLQQFRHQDDAAGGAGANGGVERDRVKAGHAAPAKIGKRQQMARHAAQQRRVETGHVLEQKRKRQYREVALKRQIVQPPVHRLGRRPQAICAQADALRRAGAARGEGYLGRAGRQLGRGYDAAHPCQPLP